MNVKFNGFQHCHNVDSLVFLFFFTLTQNKLNPNKIILIVCHKTINFSSKQEQNHFFLILNRSEIESVGPLRPRNRHNNP